MMFPHRGSCCQRLGSRPQSLFELARLYDRELAWKTASDACAGFRKSPGRTFGYLLFYAVFYVGSPVAVVYT